jgi:hypothetical protein
MLTIFTTAKPFRAHTAIIQRNAIQSWKALHSDVEIILFGDDEGAAEVAVEFGLRHEPSVERNELGTNRMDYMFLRAQEFARHELLCYINCDIILMEDFARAIERVRAADHEFLMVGQRWDTDITGRLAFERPGWQTELRSLALQRGKQRTPDYIDYFVFSRGLFGANLPPLVVGRVFWDNWTIWKALDAKHPVVDVSAAVIAVHQNHDYGHVAQGKHTVYYGEEARRNYELAGGWKHLRTIEDATEVLREDGLRPNTMRYWAAVKRYARQAGRVLLYDLWQPIWFAVLGLTRPLRRVLGLRAGMLPRSRKKV